jgi:lambda repressor-like predicted transcriptional regulator
MVAGWHPQDIVAGIRKVGWTHQMIADELGVGRSTVTLSIRTGGNSAVCSFIATLIGAPEAELWPFRSPCPPEKPRRA